MSEKLYSISQVSKELNRDPNYLRRYLKKQGVLLSVMSIDKPNPFSSIFPTKKVFCMGVTQSQLDKLRISFTSARGENYV